MPPAQQPRNAPAPSPRSAQRHHGGQQNPQHPQRNRQQNPGQPQQDAPQHLHAPYNFVPLSPWVHIPPWSRAVSHDLPFADGYSGVLHLTLTNHTPLLVGGQQTRATRQAAGQVRPFKLPDGRYALPGSSIKGLLRAVVEIAAFGRMRMVDDRRLSVRDLTAAAYEFYGKRLTRNLGNTTFQPLSRAGWLTYDAKQQKWTLTPCQFARIEHDDLAKLSHNDWWRKVPGESTLKSDRRETASCMVEKKYREWGMNRLEIHFDPSPENIHLHSGGKKLVYIKADPKTLGRGSKKGYLVFTGQPADRDDKPGKKHLEFIFYDESQPRDIDERIIRDFLRIHEESEVWKFWKNQNTRIPVFYLADEKQRIESIGLALMYRLAYPFSTHDLIRHSSPMHLQQPGAAHGYDFADLLFGAINESPEAKAQADALRGRVSCGLMVATGKFDDRQQLPTRQHPPTILNGPKPSYFPNYITQPRAKPPQWKLQSAQEYATYIATPQNQAPTLRGFKRYPVRPEGQARVQPLTGDQPQNTAVQTVLHTINPGARFTGRIVFHNLKREELGALLWAITWGNNKALRHALGMGKPFGFGQVQLEIDFAQSQIIPNDPQQPPAQLDDAQIGRFVQDFEAHMQQAAAQCPGGPIDWKNSPQLVNLLAMADPRAAEQAENKQPGFLTHPILGVGARNNPFVQAKQQAKVLPDYAVFTGRMAYVPPMAGKRQPCSQSTAAKPAASDTGKPATVAPAADFQERTETWTNCTVIYDPSRRSAEATAPDRARAVAASLDTVQMDDALKSRLRKDKQLRGLTVEVLRKGASMAQIQSIRKP